MKKQTSLIIIFLLLLLFLNDYKSVKIADYIGVEL